MCDFTEKSDDNFDLWVVTLVFVTKIKNYVTYIHMYVVVLAVIQGHISMANNMYTLTSFLCVAALSLYIFYYFYHWSSATHTDFLWKKSVVVATSSDRRRYRFLTFIRKKMRLCLEKSVPNNIKNSFYKIRSGIFKWVFKSGVCRKLWPQSSPIQLSKLE